MADRYISAVRYNDKPKCISKVKVHPNNGGTLGTPVEETRATVITNIGQKVTYMTMTAANGKWVEGAAVKVVTISGTKYIKTYSDNTEADNLGELPQF